MVSLELLDDLGVGGVPLDGVDPVQGAGLGLVALAHGDDLPVAGLEPEPGLAGLVRIDLVLGVLLGLVALDGLVLDLGHAVLPHGLDPVLGAVDGLVGLGGADDLAVGGEEVENVLVVLALLDDELSHVYRCSNGVMGI